MVEVLTPINEQMAIVKELMNLRRGNIETVFDHALFSNLVSRWLNDIPNSPMLGAEYQKIIDI